jgi:hypothetical protein
LTCTGGAEQCVQDNQPVTEDVASGNCGDELDNDCDGLTDTDPECVVVGQEVNCFDGIDNDDDGATDCVDTDCYNAVGGPQTICGVGVRLQVLRLMIRSVTTSMMTATARLMKTI